MPENWLKDCVTGWVHADGTVCDEHLAPPASTPPGNGYWCTTHQMFVRHPDSPMILEVSRYAPDEDPPPYRAKLIPARIDPEEAERFRRNLVQVIRERAGGTDQVAASPAAGDKE